MADFQNAGYRLLSFKYTAPPPPPPTEKGPHPEDDVDPEKDPLPKDDQRAQVTQGAHAQGGDGELPSLSSLLASLQEIDAAAADTNAETTKPGAADMKADEHDKDAERGEPAPTTPTPLTEFHPFPDLPTELRLKIWALTFLPRVVELRPTRPNYSAGRMDGDDCRAQWQSKQWQSGNTNPAALAVNVEAREAALAHFRIAFPLAAITTTTITSTASMASSSAPSSPSPSPAPFSLLTTRTTNTTQPTLRLFPPSPPPKARLLHRTLHLSPTHDTICLLGQDSDITRLAHLITTFRAADPLNTGLTRLGLSVRGWGYGGSAVMLATLGRGVLSGLDQLVLFMYGEHLPPAGWRAGGGQGGRTCGLVEIAGDGGSSTDAYRVWKGGQGRQFWDAEGRMMRLGKEGREIQVLDLVFEDGW